MSDLSKKCEQLIPLYETFDSRNFFLANEEAVKRFLRERIGDAEYLYTSRVDGDDAINVRFVERLQDSFDPLFEGVAVTFRFGCAHIPETKRTGCKPHGTNMFLSTVEKWDDSVTSVLPHHHQKWQKYHYLDPNWQKEQIPFWLYCTHEHNLINEFNYGKEISVGDVNRFFGLKL